MCDSAVVVCDSAMLLQVQVRRETAARLTHYKEGDGASVFVECCVERDTRRTSHVTRHTSHVTRHTSHVTRHASHVTRHTSHVTRHTSHVTRHTSHVTRHASQEVGCRR